MPKFNLYQSLHTTVIGPDGRPLEVQIRTREMHRRAESGIAAHWRYKEGGGAADLQWMADVRFLHEEYRDPNEFLAGLKLDLYQDEVFVLTPAGDVRTLPRGATPVDFAYTIHTEVGNRCVGARVNGRLVSLGTTARVGRHRRDPHLEVARRRPEPRLARVRPHLPRPGQDQAVVLQGDGATSPSPKVATRSRPAIRKEGLGLSAAERDRQLESVSAEMGLRDLDALFAAVGEGSTSAVDRHLPDGPQRAAARRRATKRSPRRPPAAGPPRAAPGSSSRATRGCGCGSPAAAPRCRAMTSSGFVTVGRGVSVHRSDCTNIAAMGAHRERMIDVSWAPDRVGSFTIWVQVEALDRTRLLRDVTSAISDQGGNIVASSSATGRDRVAVLRYEIELSDPGQVPRLLDELRRVEGAYDAYRLVPRAGGTD